MKQPFNGFCSRSSTYTQLTLFATCVAALSVEAQDSTPATSRNQLLLEEVIVTARKREEMLQETPVAISAFNNEELRLRGIANTRDLQQSVPGLSFSEQGNKAPSIFIRGVGQKESNAALDPGVGVYINGIYIPRTDSQLLDVMDTESIQVLRGPQGTLFGKNNTGGALIVTTMAPHTEDYEGEISTRIGNHGRADAKASANIPLIEDKLAARIGLNRTKRDGYMESEFDGKEYGDEDRLGATARLLWQPTNNLDADLFYYWSKIKENGGGLTCVLQNPKGVFNSFAWPNFNTPDAFASQCRASEEASDDTNLTINGPTSFKQTSQILGLTFNWQVGDFEIKSITAWNHQDGIKTGDDSDGTDIPGVNTGRIGVAGAVESSLSAGYGDFPAPDDEERNQYSQELQLTGSAFDERLTYTTGIFLSREDIDNTIGGNLVGDRGYSYKIDTASLIPKIIGTNSDLTNESYAAYLQGTYEVTDWYQLTLGTRYTKEKRDRTATLYEADCETIVKENFFPGSLPVCEEGVLLVPDPTDFYANPPQVLPIRLVEDYLTLDGNVIEAVNGKVKKDEDWSKWTPTVTNAFTIPDEYLTDTPIDSSLLYLTYSRGFKSGGFEMKGLEIAEFDPEEVNNYEIGFKIDAFDQRLRFNSAFYYMDYDDIQIRITEQGISFADILLYVDNAGAATIKGFELELTALPLPNVILNATTSYTDASYDNFIASDVDTDSIPPVQSTVDRSDEDLAAVPKLTYSLSAMAILPTDVGDFTPRLSMYYRDKLYTGLDATAWDTQFRDRATIDDVTLWNFRLGYIPPTWENIQVFLYVDNITDENYFQGGFSNTESLGAGSFVLGEPRSYGIEISIAF
ncbi:MAG: TonB-dependent receptor [Halioglobus sp.]|nr:TonB-dependent receptor [Halioglobus sp.]